MHTDCRDTCLESLGLGVVDAALVIRHINQAQTPPAGFDPPPHAVGPAQRTPPPPWQGRQTRSRLPGLNEDAHGAAASQSSLSFSY